MLEKIIVELAHKISSRFNIKDDRKVIIGILLTVSILTIILTTSMILIVSIVEAQLITGIAFAILFGLIRFWNGEHLETAGKCFLATSIIFLLVIAVTNYVPLSDIQSIIFVIVVSLFFTNKIKI